MAQELIPPSSPRIFLASTNPETLFLQWNSPADLNSSGITNYAVTCVGSNSLIHTAVVFFPNNNAIFADLIPETQYTCSVVAFNRFGASPAAVISANTTMRTDDPGALFIFLKPNITYITVTSDGIKNSNGRDIVNPPVLLTTTDDIQDMDYDYQKKLLYFTSVEVGGVSAVKRAKIQLGMNGRNFEITLQGLVEVLHFLGAEVNVSHITVDWVNSELYYVETASSNSRIFRLVLNETGSDILSQACVVELVKTTITNIKVDPVHGYFYYGTGTTIFRVDLSSVQMNTMMCPSSIGGATAIGSFDTLYGFTIEQDEAIYILAQDLQACGVNGRALSLNLGGQNNTLFSYSSSLLFTRAHLDSFTQYIVVGVDSRIIYVPTNTVVAGCSLQSIILQSAHESVSLIRMFRRSQQPTPIPLNSPTSIRVSTEGNTSAVSWSAPVFPGSLYSEDAFDGWTYIVRYCVANTQNCMEATTMEQSVLLIVEYNTSYVLSISAVGPGGQNTTSSEVLFTSEPNDGLAAQLVIAHKTGIIQSNLSGQSAEMVLDSRSSSTGTPDSVAVDSYTDTVFWVSEGSSAIVYKKIGSRQSQALYRNRDQSFALEYDWVGNRLLWVENSKNPQDSCRVLLGDLENPSAPLALFVETNSAVATAIDSSNGLFFWTDSITIHMQTLSGIALADCYTPPDGALSLAVDAARRNLFWLSCASAGHNLKISQLDYTGTECNATILAEQDLGEISLSSRFTILAYASNKLFITSRLSSKIYTVSSCLASVGPGQSLALGEVKLTGTVTNTLTSALEIRDMAVSSTSLQTLPGVLTPQSRGLAGLQPIVPSREPYLNATLSTSATIVIMWGRSEVMGVPDAVILYVVSYTLQKDATVSNGSVQTSNTFISIGNQQTDTNVTASVVVFSSWTRSTDSATASFLSLPPRPGQVVNVQVFLYNPLITDPAVRTALVIWDNVEGSVTSFSVRVIDYSTGMELSPLDEPRLDLKTSYSVLLTESGDDPPSFPLVIGQSYGVEVCAVNAAGAGPASDRVNFTVSATGLSYPMQVLSLESSGLVYYGSSTSINQNLMVESNAGPIVVDTVDRRAYWYEETFNLIICQPLGIGGVFVPFLTVPTGIRVVSLTYDWIAKVVYMSRVNISTQQLELVKVEIFDIVRQQIVFPNLQFTLPANAVVNSEMNPVTGFFYWSITETATNMYVLDLRNANVITITPVTVGSSMISLTPALALDPVTNNLLVSDRATGDILQCSQTFASCSVYVNRSALEATSGRVNVGLPAGSVKYGGQFVYWTSTSSLMPGVFAVDTSDRSTLIVVTDQSTPRFIVPLSPNQQPLPDIDLLSPSILPINRQDISVVKATSTTLLMSWRNSDTFGLDFSPNMPFSLAPFVYDVINRLTMVQTTKHVTRMRRILLTDLIPFTSYTVFIAAKTQYSQTFGTTPFEFAIVSTTEGVPQPPALEMYTVVSTTRARVQWFHVPENALHGRVLNRVYIVSSESGNITTSDNSALVSGPVASHFTIQLYTFNGVFISSTSTSVSIQLWSIVQQPNLVSKDNSSIVVNVTISEAFFGEIREVGIMACDLSMATRTAYNCTCTNITDSFNRQSFMPIMSIPMTHSFTIENLRVFTEYCIYPIGYYSTPEVTGGVGVFITTASGVPNAPNIMRNQNFLNWIHPESNGRNITSYTLFFRPRSQNISIEMVKLNFASTSFDLNNAPIVESVQYSLSLLATNLNGNSNESNTIDFEKSSDLPLTSPTSIRVSTEENTSTVNWSAPVSLYSTFLLWLLVWFSYAQLPL